MGRKRALTFFCADIFLSPIFPNILSNLRKFLKIKTDTEPVEVPFFSG
jgi:hypothetical protein